MPEIQELLQENEETKLEVVTKKAGCTNNSLVLLPLPRRRPAPWLVFFSHGKQQKLQTFVSLSEGRVFVREDVEELSRTCFYAQHGSWLFLADLPHSSCFLMNLSSSSSSRKKKIVTLPPPPRGATYITDAVITRSSPPPDQHELGKGSSSSSKARAALVILAYRINCNVFMFHRVGDAKWGMARCRVKDGISSLVRCNGTIYALGGPREDLVVIDVDVDAAACRPRVTALHVEDVAIPRDTSCIRQLLESCGELFLVWMHFVLMTDRFYSFAVYKLDSAAAGVMRWVEVGGLGEDRAFFFGTRWFRHWGPGMSCSASAAGIAANCIYFVDLESDDHNAILKFDMADKSVSTVMSWPMAPKPWTEVGWVKNIHASL